MTSNTSNNSKKATVGTQDRESTDLRRKLELDWTESEWFEVWLRLARHEQQDS